MKMLIIAAMAAQIATASAVVTVQVNNNNGTDTNLVTDNAGAKLPTGGAVAAIGYFDVADGLISDFSSFVQVGSTYADFVTTDGFFLGGVDIDLSAGGVDEAAVGKSVYIVIGDNTSNITKSDNWMVFKHQETYTAPPTEGPSAASLIDGQGTLIKGKFGTYSFDNGNGLTGAFTLVQVPEPSSTALLGLGIVGFIIRRRR